MKKVIHTESGKYSGWVEEGTFFRPVKKSVHQLRKPLAFCMDASIVKELQDLKVTTVHFFDKQIGMTWRTKLHEFIASNLVIDRGHGVQVGVEMSRWNVDVM